MDHARRHVEANLERLLSLAALAEAAGLSPYHFSRLFTGRHGFSPMAYVRVRRLEAAACSPPGWSGGFRWRRRP
jgi:transcriptional regulator GlxA family with amidase domain